MNNKRIIMFSHIPKTAGTSLKFLLRRHFGLSQMDARFNNKIKDLSYRPEDLRNEIQLYRKLNLICGHCIKSYVNFLEYEKNMEWFTFLRNPLHRFVSHYIHEQTGKNKRYHMNLIDWSNRFKRNDIMVRWIAGNEDVEKAKDLLHNRFKFIGLTEQFDESMRLLKNAFQLNGFDIKLDTKKMIVRSNNLKSEIYNNYHKYEDIIYTNNKLDTELYEYFLKYIWDEQIKKFDYFDEKDVKIKHELNSNLGFLHRNLVYKPYTNVKNKLRKWRN